MSEARNPSVASVALEAPVRYLLHAAILLVVVAAALFGAARAQASRNAVIGGSAAVTAWQSSPNLAATGQEYFRALSLPTSSTPAGGEGAGGPPAREGITSYRVLPGDTPIDIATRFGLTVDSILQANGLKDGDIISIGQEMIILPASGALHKVVAGNTLASIAKTYGVEVKDIVSYAPNEVSEASALSIGKVLLVPNGIAPAAAAPAPVVVAARPAPTPAPAAAAAAAPAPAQATAPVAASGRFAWATSGPITQWFSSWHRGLDIAPRYGTPVYAADAGTVINIQRWTWGYGWHIYIDHGNGYITLYGHLSSINVNVGQRVAKGQLIANVGSTGQSTGPHLHFEIRYLGVAQNPIRLLP